ncbi:neutral/alkaline non-lysosomal ceramidase N-terminal domain-containing protein [Larkinella harenae]
MKRPFFLLLFVLCTVSLQAQQLRAGAAVRVITPNPLLPVSGGISTPKKATEKKGDLFVRAFVLEKGATRLAIVSVDNLGWPAVLGNQSRALIKSIPPENILIGATHTHSGPDAYGFPDPSGKTLADLPYLEKCVKQIAEAVEEAVTTLQPARLKIAVGEAKGKIAFNYYADDLYDPRCGVIQALTVSGKPIATLVNYAIHPEVIGSNRGILSPDLCGPLYDKIESKTGGMALFMNGAQGGMVTADVRREGGKEANTWEECIRIGELLGEEALRIIGSAPVLDNPSLYCVARPVEFPIESEMMKSIIRKSPLGYELSSANRITTQVNLLNIGPAQILTIPGEALPNIGYYVKRHMNTKLPFLFGLTNDAFGYMLTKVDFKSFKRYDYISQTSLGEMTGEIYMDQALKLVSESPKAEP